MAKKKPRTPPPPRPVQAPQRRTTKPRAGGDDMGLRHRKLLYYGAGGGAVVLVAIVLFVVLGGGGTADAKAIASAMTKAGCSYKNVTAYVPKGQGTHVNSLTAKLPWNTDPPSNGQHYPEWAVWGFYNQAVNPRMVVHNEEHGGVILWWGSQVPASTVAQLKAFYDEKPGGSFGTPYPSLGSKIAITAWTGNPDEYQQNGYYGEGHIGICPSYTAATKNAFEKFRDAYRGKGPEGIPLCDDQPGDSTDKSSC
ncbi:MAG TPA: DUF3105 domain-containing protein [Gaiellaceae bacterium]|nr:DUF3105 domain-containing protein [Gaiellaceae bacterium]